jgi:hypothetical protein
VTKSLTAISGTHWTRPEPFQRLIPGWLVICLAVLLFGAILAQASSAKAPSSDAIKTVHWTAICGGAWQIHYSGRSDFTARTTGSLSTFKTECTLPIVSGVDTIDVRVVGAAAAVRAGPGKQDIALMLAGTSLAIPVNPQGDAIIVQPLGAGNISVTVSKAQ